MARSRGVTPTAPKPINLPSQKLESHQLIPDVEIVPRGTCCWGSIGRSPPCGENIDHTGSACLLSGIDGTVDEEVEEPTYSSLSDDVQSPVEEQDSTLCAGISSSPASFNDDITPVGSYMGCDCASDGYAKAADVESSFLAQDVDTFSENVTCPFTSETDPSSLVNPCQHIASGKMEEQCLSVKDFEQCTERCPHTSGSRTDEESSRGPQDFGYFEGFYNAQVPCVGVDACHPKGQGMIFGSGFKALEIPQHYSILGVPYYDSVKDKEIVVITMVGNPGFGSYPSYPAFPGQHNGAMVYGNTTLEFGHFEHCVRPEVTSNMSSFCPEVNYKDGWNNYNVPNNLEGVNGFCSPTFSSLNLNTASEEHGILKRNGKPKHAYRNRKAREASGVLAPERRVTLLTKVSQHEIVISDTQTKMKPSLIRKAKSKSGQEFFPLDSTEVSPVVQSTREDGREFAAHGSHNIPIPTVKSSGIIHDLQCCALQPTTCQQVSESNGTYKEDIMVERSYTLDALPISSRNGPCMVQTSHQVLDEASVPVMLYKMNKESEEIVHSAPLMSSELPDTISTSAVSATSNEDVVLVSSSESDARILDSEHPVPPNSKASPGTVSLITAASEDQSLSVHVQEPLPSTDSQAISQVSVPENKICESKILQKIEEVPIHTCPSMPDESVLIANGCTNDSELVVSSKVGEICTVALSNMSSKLVSGQTANNCLNGCEPSTVSTGSDEHALAVVQALHPKRSTRVWRPKTFTNAIKKGQNGSKPNHEGSRQKIYESSREIPGESLYISFNESWISSPSGNDSTVENVLSSPSRDPPDSLSNSYNSESSDETGVLILCPVEATHDDLLICEGHKNMTEDSVNNVVEPTQRVCQNGSLEVLGSPVKEVLDRAHNSQLKTIPCGRVKKWRPKLASNCGHEHTAENGTVGKTGEMTKCSNTTDCELSDHSALASGLLSLQINNKGSGNNHTSSKHAQKVEVSEADLVVPSSASKVSGDSQKVDKFQHLSSDNCKNFSCPASKEQSTEDNFCVCTTRSSLAKAVNESFRLGKSTCPIMKDGEEKSHRWRVVGKQPHQQKLFPVNEHKEASDCQPDGKSKQSVSFQSNASQVSWKVKQPFMGAVFSKGSTGQLEGKVSDSNGSTGEVEGSLSGPVDVKKQDDRKPFSMKPNFLNDDIKKAAPLQCSQPFNLMDMEHVKVRERIHLLAVDDNCYSLNKNGRMHGSHNEFHVHKKVERKGWVVKHVNTPLKA
ncbi:hypothetical protein KP509_09G003000 [Ceratopteris richardii]|uniref:Uncharacterized protein n=3 Tax=Ceratopteris richardii TaxID=49495 RepID=A0A8T2U1E3_CERRI|nr:hypothetical protein KP509_09G003000 [Ceratopteris richardii]KAH7428470.1 hypothetical protein KP509_09G003000 [Ceratopteris richardii]